MAGFYCYVIELLALCYCLCWLWLVANNTQTKYMQLAKRLWVQVQVQPIFFYLNVQFGNSLWCPGWPKAQASYCSYVHTGIQQNKTTLQSKNIHKNSFSNQALNQDNHGFKYQQTFTQIKYN